MSLKLDAYEPRAGDLLGFAAPWNDPVGALIKVATLSRITHIAGVARVTRDQVAAENARRWGERFKTDDVSPRRLLWPGLGAEVGGQGPEAKEGSEVRGRRSEKKRPSAAPCPPTSDPGPLLPSPDLRPPASGLSLLIESTTLCAEPCLLQGQSVRGVQAHWPAERIEQYLARGGRAWLYRPSVDWQLFGREKDLLAEFLLSHVGDSYDYGAAVLSAERLFKTHWWWRSAHAHSCFCSYLWDAALQRIGRLGAGDAATVNPAGLLRTVTKIGRYQLLGEFE